MSAPPETIPERGDRVAPSTPPPQAPHGADNPVWEVSLYGGARDNRPRRLALDWRGLTALLTDHVQFPVDADKRNLPAWSPAVLPEGATRANDRVEAVSCIVLDYDDGTSPDVALVPWLDWPCVLHSSWSHSDTLTKFRLIVPLARAVPLRAWRWVWSWAASRAAGTIDRACKDASRLYFLPAHREAAPRFALLHDPGGHLCDPDWDRQTDEALALAGRAQEAVAARARADIPPTPTAAGKGRDVARETFRRDPAARRRVADFLGAKTTAERAYGIRCPKCGDRSVWFLLEPDKKAGCECNHKNSCGWFGWIDQLSEG